MSDSDSDDSLLGETNFTSRTSERVTSTKKLSLKSKFEALEAEASERLDKRIKVAKEMQQQQQQQQQQLLQQQHHQLQEGEEGEGTEGGGGTLTDTQLKDLEDTLETVGQRRDRLREEEEEEER
ncbi:hypothetical protein TrRE_jg3091, partial [Triparma retinervis]